MENQDTTASYTLTSSIMNSSSAYSLSSWSTNIGTCNTLGSYTYPIYSGSGYTYSGIFEVDTTMDDKALDVEKMSTFDDTKRKMLFDLFVEYLNCEKTTSKKILLNTLNSYGIIIDKKALERKSKISDLTKK